MSPPVLSGEFVRHLRTFREELILLTLAVLMLMLVLQIWLMIEMAGL